MNQPSEIAQVNFTWALPGGMWIRRDDGTTTWVSFLELDLEVGKDEAERLFVIAKQGGMTGMWYNARNGRNVYTSGVCMNP